MQINDSLRIADLKPHIERFFECSGQKILAIEDTWPPEKGTPVFTVAGTYTTRGWTEWTQGLPIRIGYSSIRCYWGRTVP